MDKALIKHLINTFTGVQFLVIIATAYSLILIKHSPMELIKVTEQKEPGVALIELNRPKELNALSPQLMQEMRDALMALDKNDAVKVDMLKLDHLRTAPRYRTKLRKYF